MRLLILGSEGYIGSTLYEYLRAYHVVDRRDVCYWGQVNWFGELFEFDYDRLSIELLSQYDFIILLAGNSSVQMCSNLIDTFDQNVHRFTTLLSKLEIIQSRAKIDNMNVPVLIYASSASVYGSVKRKKHKESDKLSNDPKNYYDASKIMIDLYSQKYNVQSYGLRFGTVCGGNTKNFRTDLVMNRMYLDSKEKKEITISNGDAMRGILGLNDLCRAIETIISGPLHPGIYNISSFNTSIDNIAKFYKDKYGIKIKKGKNTKNGYSFSLNTSKFEQQFNFKFKDNLKSIVEDLEHHYQFVRKKGARDHAIIS